MDWNDHIKNKVLQLKIDQDLLLECGASFRNSWQTNRQIIRKRFGYSVSKIHQLIMNFARDPDECAITAFGRYVRLLRHPKSSFQSATDEHKRCLIRRGLQLIFPPRVCDTVITLWIQENESTNIQNIFNLLKKVEQMYPINEFAQVNITENEESQVFVQYSEPSSDTSACQDLEVRINKIIDDKMTKFRAETKKTLDAYHMEMMSNIKRLEAKFDSQLDAKLDRMLTKILQGTAKE